MSLYSINFSNFVNLILPISKRKTNTKTFIGSLISPISWLRGTFFESYYLGADVTRWVSGTYNYMDEVIYDKKVYVSLINGNTDIPNNSANWYQFQSNFLGAKSRVKIDSSKVVLEWALNKYFDTLFQQPSTGLNSYIYISNTNTVLIGFTCGEHENYSSEVGLTTSDDAVTLSPVVSLGSNFAINVPYASTITDLQITKFADKYIPISMKYSINRY